jgi:23S rRNA (pseudouridine1915-N3)-methyltransferase
MKINLFFLGKTKEKYLASGIKDYFERLRRYTTVSITILKEKKRACDDNQIVLEEGKQLLSKIEKKAFVVALDPTGSALTSEQLAEKIELWENQAYPIIIFLIGGPTGLSNEVQERADFILSLSQMTFTHEMARFILLEQLYRAFSIKAGSKYHK